jgi:pimeloyl-ACP methyl ester carboxylesterase
MAHCLLFRGQGANAVNFAARFLVVLIVASQSTVNVALAQSLPLPGPLRQILEQAGVLAYDGSARLGQWQSIYQVPVRNSELAALMERARREDEIVPLTHALFAPEHAAAGLWHSPFYLENYGTALVLAAGFDDDRPPVVLVPGIGGSPRDFADLVPVLQRAGYQPLYFVYPSGMPLADAARQLAERLQEFLQRHDVDRLVVIGHSMGGVVAKGLLDQVDLPSWRLFIAIASPFGGVDMAQYANRLPQHPPAWDDLAPNSAFMHRIRSTRFPADLHFYLFFGARSSSRLMGALGNNDGVLSIESICGSPVTAWARDVFGFYEDHTSILSAPRVLSRVENVLNTEVAP